MNGQLLSKPAHYDKASHNLASERSGNAKSEIPRQNHSSGYGKSWISHLLGCSSV